MATQPAHIVAFGLALRRARKKRDLTQETVASNAGLTAKHLSEIERGNRDPRLSTVTRILEALDLPHDELWDLYRLLVPALSSA
jgi:transcriptional regulator with XRE-family HTH domain